MEQNRSKRRISRIMAGMLAIVLCFATSLTALAGVGGAPGNEQEAEFTKTLQFASGVGLTTPGGTLTFNFAKTSLDGATTPAALTAMPAIGPEILTFTAGEASTLNIVTNMEEVTKTSGDVLSGLTWTSTGVYEYLVTETASGFTLPTGETMNYSGATYKMYVVVSYDTASSSYFVEETYTDQITGQTGGTGSGKGGANTADLNYNFEFLNTYVKLGGSTSGTDSLTITKTTTGTGSDQTKQFTYTLKANDFVTGLAPATYIGTLTRANSTIVSVVLVADGSTTATFTLADGEELVFDSLPAGTTFEVEETGAASYIATYSGTTAGGSITSGAGTAGTNLSTGTQTIGTINNEVNFTNTFDNSLIPTGILNNVVPVVALLAVVVLGFIAFAALNRRKASR